MMENLHIINGLYAITPEQENLSILCSQVESCIKGGAKLIQYRSKKLSKIDQKKQAKQIKILCNTYNVPLIINDNIELCRILDADGVHLGEDDDNLLKARKLLGPSKIIGISCYNSIDRVKIAIDGGANYVALGACFSSNTKKNAPQVSMDLITLVLKEFKIPLVAIGGIDTENVELLVKQGVKCVALINGLFQARDVEKTARIYTNVLKKNYER